jgi:hypothetical protein
MAQSTTTVTVANPTPPTNFSFVSYGSPPSTPGLTPVDDGTAGAITAIAAPISGPVAEASGTVVVVAATSTNPSANGQLQMLSVMGNYTNSPNSQHASSLSPAVNPTLVSIAPASTASGAGTIALTATGTGFTSQSVVYVNGVAQVTVVASSTSLTVAAAPKRPTAGTWPVTVITGGAVTTAPQTWTFT